MARTGPLADLSGPQLVAGALAAMTSAWMASWLGVAGTLIGAAVGSIVAGIAAALYRSSLERGIQRSKTILTEQGSVVEHAKGGPSDPDETGDADDSPAPSLKERLRRLNWRSIAIVSAATLLVAIVVIGVYEAATGTSYGRSSNPTIVPTSLSRDGGEKTPGPEGDAPTTEAPGDTTPTEQTPTSRTPADDAPSTEPPPTEAPTEPAPMQPGPGEGGESAPDP